jgi:hypothetical protein
MALALAPLAAHLGAGLARDRDGAIRRIVVVDVDLRGRQRFAEIRNHGRDRGLLVVARHQDRDPQRHRLDLLKFPLRELRQRIGHAGEIAAKRALGIRHGTHGRILNGN